MKRQAVAELQRRKLALITGIWANEGFNEKDARDETLEQLEDQFKEAERVVFLGRAEQERQQDKHRFTTADEENPFLKPAIEATRKFDVPRDDEGRTAGQVAQSEYEVDQD